MASFPPPTTGRPLVRVASTSGRVDLIAEDRTDVDVRGDAEVTRTSVATTITGDHHHLVIRVPTGIDVVIGTTSGRVDLTGSLGATAVTTDSGRIGIADATSIDARSNKGRIEIGRCAQQCCLRSDHGAVVVRSCGSADVATTTGRISLREVQGVARAHCTNGRVDITMATANDVSAETVTGRINVSMPPNVRVFHTDLAQGSTERPDGADCVVATHSVTGRVEVVNR